MSLLKTIINACDDINAQEIEILDMENKSPLFDYMVICTARSDRQLRGIVDHIAEEVEKNEYTVKQIEGKNGNLWVLVDCIDVIVHVFVKEERDKYNIERLWGECKRLDASEFIEQR
jgi:ribosome-associated protein